MVLNGKSNMCCFKMAALKQKLKMKRCILYKNHHKSLCKILSVNAWNVAFLTLNLAVHTSSSIIPYSQCKTSDLEPCKNHPLLVGSIICENIKDVRIFTKVIHCASTKNFQEVFLEESSIEYLSLVVLDFSGFFYLNMRSVVLSRFFDEREMIRLKHLHLDNVTIHSPWNWKPLSVLTYLQRFSVANMLVENINGDLVDNLNDNLQSFALTSTNTSSIQDNAFSKFSNLAYISIQNNDIKHLCRSMFPRLAKIRYFHFGKNKISTLPEDIFHQMPDLEVVAMQGNLISQINEATFRNSWSKLTIVSLEGNPLKCHCKMLWLLKKRTPSIFKGECYAPKREYGKHLKDLTINDFHC